MSLDYPFYEELKKRNSPAAKWWKIGDSLYYLGLLPAVICIVLTPCLLIAAYVFEMQHKYWQFSLILFIISVIVFFIGSYLKARSYAIGKSEGVNINDY